MRRPRALVVIADPTTRDTVRDELERAGFGIELPADGTDAAARAVAAGGDRVLVAEAENTASGPRLRPLETRWRPGPSGASIVGCSAAVERIRHEVLRLAATDATVWLVGPEGAGKEHVARAIHAGSPRAEAPFVVAACRAVDGGDQDGPWAALLEQARGGTVYLDDVSSLSLETQHALERAIADGKVAAADVRVIAASLDEASRSIEDRRILRPLHRRLASATLVVPSLAERVEDVPLLARHFLDEIAEINGTLALALDPRALQRLSSHGWQGHVQELRNTIEHAALLAEGGTIREGDLPERIRAGVAPAEDGGAAARGGAASFRSAKREVVEAFERTYLRELMARHEGNVTAASAQAGMLRSALQRLLRKYGLKSAEFRRRARPAGRGAVGAAVRRTPDAD